MKAISIAMTTFNGEKYIAEQLDSLAKQTMQPAELVLCDDGSSDRTLTIVREFAATVPFPVKIVQNETRLGFGDNFLKAASLTSGDLVAFCDQDDVWLPHKLARCAAEFENPETLLCVHTAELWNGKDRSGLRIPDYRKRVNLPPRSLYPMQGTFGFAMVVRRDLFEVAEISPRWSHMGSHDQWAWMVASVLGRVSLLPDLLALYRQHGGNVYGAGSAKTGDVLAGGLKTRDYVDRANVEDRAAEYLHLVAEKTTPKWSGLAEQGAELMARCARVNRLRQQVYSSSFAERLRAFGRMIAIGGYADPALRNNGVGKPPSAPWWRPFLKDLVIGVFGFARLMQPASRAFARLRRS